jgi:dTDP-4-amino-4,6-dideoxygalactose transaminase
MIRSWLSNWAPLSPSAFVSRPSADLPYPFGDPRAQLYASGRQALWHGLRALGLGAGDEVLCPAYHAGPDVEAMLNLGIAVPFYGGRPDLSPDPDELEALLTDRTRALYLIHYLGFAQDAPRWRRWCDERDLLLIEDAAQGWLSELDGRPLGSFGDLAFTNPYKKLPAPNGAFAISDRPLEAPRGRQPLGFTRDWEPVDQSGSLAHMLSAWVGQHVGAIGAARMRLRGGANNGFDPLEHAQLGDLQERPARSSTYLLPRVATRDVRVARRANYARLLETLADHVPEPFAELTDGACPWFFPVNVASPQRALEALLGSGVSTIHYWAQGHPACETSRFPHVAERRATTLALPVHQGLRPAHVEQIATAAHSVLAAPAAAPG